MSFGRGYTLIELLITVLIVAVLVLATAPLATNWVAKAQAHSGSTVLQQAFSVAKALALENPNGVTNGATPTAAAGLKITTDGTTTTLLVCPGSAATAACVSGNSNVQWSATYSGLVTTTISAAVNSSTGTTTTTSQTAAVGASVAINFDNRGEAMPLNTLYSYSIARGDATNGESNALY
jgi:prepilin-type N-terminal cleavage/methylation domain-containing protein